MKRFAGVDIGATRTRVGLLNEEGQIVRVASYETDPKDVTGPIYKFLDGNRFEGIGISCAGYLSPDGRAIVHMANTHVRDLRIVEQMEARFNVPAFLFNDCVAALLAEVFMGSGKDSKNIAYLTLSTGVGAAILDNGRLVFGKDGNAREIGHSKLSYDSKLKCSCGQYGCIESFIGGKNIGRAVSYLRRTVFRDGESALDKTRNLTPALFFQIARKDRVAKQIQDELGKILAMAIANINTLYDPELVIIGGAVMLAHQELLMGYITRLMPKFTGNRLPRVLVTGLGENICLNGAGLGAINPEWVKERFLPAR